MLGARVGVIVVVLWPHVAAAALAGEGMHKAMRAQRVDRAPVIDGRLNDEVWALAEPSGDFHQEFPLEGNPATEQTQVRVLYDNGSLYVGVHCFDSRPDGISARLTRRDRDIETDWLALTIDSRHDHDSAAVFQISAAGVQVDGQFSHDADFSYDWDGVWDAAVATDATGWTAEFAIPLTQLRFSEADEQVWGFEVHRNVSRKRERSMWVLIPPGSNAFVSRLGHLEGLKGLRPQQTVEIRPFVVARAVGRASSGASLFGSGGSGVDLGLDGGFDLKLGVTTRLTLDATVNPDFGQVEADQVVLNLSRFETFFPEKRPFFMEGRELYETPIALFYPRRIGRPLSGLSVGSTYVSSTGFPRQVLEASGAVRIWGAAKLTGSISDRVSVAALAAVTAAEEVVVADGTDDSLDMTVSAARAHAVLRGRWAVGDRGFVGLTATGVTRLNGSDYRAATNHDAYSQGIDAAWQSDGGTLRLSGQVVLSERVGGSRLRDGNGRSCDAATQPGCLPITRPNGTALAPGDVGYGAIARANYRGKRWRVNAEYLGASPKLDLNDLGFQTRFDYHGLELVGIHETREPSGPFQQHFIIPISYGAVDFDGTPLVAGAGLDTEFTFKNFWFTSPQIMFEAPGTWDNLETFDGAYFENAGHVEGNWVVQSNKSDRFWWSVRGIANKKLTAPGWVARVETGAYWQAAPNVELSLEPIVGWESAVRFYDCSTDGELPCLADSGIRHYLFAELDARFLSFTFRATYTFSPRLSLSAYAQLFAAQGTWGSFSAADTSGARPFIHRDDLVPTTGPEGTAFEEATLNVNVVARWEPLPGSALYAVYTRGQRSDRFDVRKLDTGPTEDIFLVKLVYFAL